MDIAAQVISVFAMAMNILSYQNKKQKMIFLFQLIGAILFAVSFFMLGAITGSILNIIGIARALVFLNKERLRADRPFWLALFTAAFIGSYILTFTVFGKQPTLPSLIIELLPVAGMTVTTVSFQRKDAKSVRVFGLINAPLWLTYNAISLSLGGVCSEIISFASIIIGYLRFDTKKKGENNEDTEA